MPLESFETSPSSVAIDDGPLLEYAPRGSGPAEQCLRIRARRVFPAARNELFAAWTTRTALESWLGFRTHSRAVVKPYSGGAFRLELAEGPIIHLITGAASQIQSANSCRSWIHHDPGDYQSTVDVAFCQRRDQSTLPRSPLDHSESSRGRMAHAALGGGARSSRPLRRTEAVRGPRARAHRENRADDRPSALGRRVASIVAHRTHHPRMTRRRAQRASRF
jgi:uncharacterized protein YndB with AHSA1/START domain